MTKAISVENVGKEYRLGSIGTRSFGADFLRWRSRGKPDSVSKDSDSIWALQNVSFQVKQGETLGIIGRNGAGKSTLLKILSRITTPTVGEIKVKGRLASLLEVGTGFHAELTGRDNVFLNGAILGMERAEVQRKFDEIVDFAGVEKFIDTPVKRYSSGMYVRLAFAVAAHLEPEILIVDEVLAVGDAEFQKKCLGKMGEVAHEGRTILFVSHNMAAIQNLCSTACLLSQGHLVFSGDTDNVIDRYLEDTRSVAQQDLKNRTDRSGNQCVKFTGLNLEDQDGNKVQEMVSGRDYSIVLGYESDGTAEDISISIGVRGNYGQFLLMCNNDMAGYHFKKLPLVGKVKCLLPKLPFSQGAYHINLYCEVKGVLADWVQEAATLDVVDGDFYGTGKGSPASHGGFMTKQVWSYVSEEFE